MGVGREWESEKRDKTKAPAKDFYQPHSLRIKVGHCLLIAGVSNIADSFDTDWCYLGEQDGHEEFILLGKRYLCCQNNVISMTKHCQYILLSKPKCF